jgi:hypothetical protein
MSNTAELERFEYGEMATLIAGAYDSNASICTSWQTDWKAKPTVPGIRLNPSMGPDAMEAYRIKKKKDDADTLKEIQKFMAEHFVVSKSVYEEVVKFRKAARQEGESVNEYVTLYVVWHSIAILEMDFSRTH